ncbi:unnamed protein product [Cyprideis torosa]|uniref:Heparan-sulfate 6-O-sulfotransferase n=1 Tax=Cyprideis torosa TaxID=163714 RepID=A0A7R8W788_9CRUS|nr:unnamed protein product [Cyprideis torosa]CAG0887338.1 unnamed protein product [Cyprideis torosa]
MNGSGGKMEAELEPLVILDSSEERRIKRGSGGSKQRSWKETTWKLAKLFFMLDVTAAVCFLIFYWYYCSNGAALCMAPIAPAIIEAPGPYLLGSLVTFNSMFLENFQFNMTGNDVIVFLHIQKTGGTVFGKHLVEDLDLQQPCLCHRERGHRNPLKSRKKKGKKRCDCFRPNRSHNSTWLFSRYSTGWKCGLHADWTELTRCVDAALDEIDDRQEKRRYFYISFLREPVARFISEFKHVQRGATWRNSLHVCNGRKSVIPSCYPGRSDWSGVSLDEFLACPHNLAFNRQTRMLADLHLVDCYAGASSERSQEEAGELMLASALANLKALSFYGITELQRQSQYVFEETFGLRFSEPFEQYDETQSKSAHVTLTQEQLRKISQKNALDIKLYETAKRLSEWPLLLDSSLPPHSAV